MTMEARLMPKNLFENRECTSQEHFKLYFYAAVLDLIEHVCMVCGSHEEALKRFRFLEGYESELAECGLESCTLRDGAAVWRESLKAWEAAPRVFLPIRVLADRAGLDYSAMLTLIAIGLVEEDARFSIVFETLEGIHGERRPTLGTIAAWRQNSTTAGDVRPLLRRLLELRLVVPLNPDAPRADWRLQIPPAVWEALRGERHSEPAAGIQHRSCEKHMLLEDLILDRETTSTIATIPQLLKRADSRTLVIRGLQHSGRRSVAGAIARTLGMGTLEVRASQKGAREEDERRQIAGPLATLLHAMPVFVFDLAPGEAASVGALPGYDGPIAVVLGKQGSVDGAAAERAITLSLATPGADDRERLWSRALSRESSSDLGDIARRFRIAAGNIERSGRLAASYASLAGRSQVQVGDVRKAIGAVNRQTLDALATRVEASGDWTHLATGSNTLEELHNLESRCRHREMAMASSSPAFANSRNAGVRALFSGPSGTGKTLAARLLASRLQMDLYRVDLSTVVNKYIGETEKNLNQVFSRAEELDVILLLDEGDALLTQRTNVLTSNDRYANLETNYLLQRFESFEGIVIVTTNGAERIDNAFQRRMDVVVDFRAPEAAERWSIWQLHLPEEHSVPVDLLREISVRCNMTGGQIRNAVVHATFLSLEDLGKVSAEHLDKAIQREYRKAGAVCPLRGTPLLRAAR